MSSNRPEKRILVSRGREKFSKARSTIKSRLAVATRNASANTIRIATLNCGGVYPSGIQVLRAIDFYKDILITKRQRRNYSPRNVIADAILG